RDVCALCRDSPALRHTSLSQSNQGPPRLFANQTQPAHLSCQNSSELPGRPFSPLLSPPTKFISPFVGSFHVSGIWVVFLFRWLAPRLAPTATSSLAFVSLNTHSRQP